MSKLLEHARSTQGFRKGRDSKGTTWRGHCPCQPRGRANGENWDRFAIWEDTKPGGTWECFRCGKHGDLADFLEEFCGYTKAQALAEAGVRGVGRPSSRRRSPEPPARRDAVAYEAAERGVPPAVWQRKARLLVEACHSRIMRRPARLEYLAARGVPKGAVAAFGLGVLEETRFRERSGWGLPPLSREDGRAKKLFFPAGLVVPTFSEAGQVVRVRFRQDAPLDPSRKYINLAGSWMGYSCVGGDPSGNAIAYVITEAELDAIAVAWACRDAVGLVGAMALGSVSPKPDAAAWERLRSAGIVLVALDFDKAAATQFPWWQRQLPQAVRWPVPEGKDPGDFFERGGDLRAWVRAGLPLRMREDMRGAGRPLADDRYVGGGGMHPLSCGDCPF